MRIEAPALSLRRGYDTNSMNSANYGSAKAQPHEVLRKKAYSRGRKCPYEVL